MYPVTHNFKRSQQKTFLTLNGHRSGSYDKSTYNQSQVVTSKKDKQQKDSHVPLKISRSIPTSQQVKCGIDYKYLNPLNYLTTCQFAKKRNILYKNYCTSIQSYYMEFNSVYEKFNKKLNRMPIQKNQKFPFIKQFKSFLVQFFYTFHEVSIVHIDYFDAISNDYNKKQEILEYNTQQFIQKIKCYEKSQLQFQVTSKKHHIKLHQIYSLYEHLKKDEKDPLYFFNKKNITKKAKQLLQNLLVEQKIRQGLRKDLDEVYDHSMEYENNLLMYRQYLFANKYKIMKKLIEMSKNSKNSLTQLLVYLYDCVSRKNNQFVKFLKDSTDVKIRKRSRSITNMEDKLAIQSYLIQITNEYSKILGEIQGILANIAEFLQDLRKFTSTQSQNNQQILQLLNFVYDVDETPNKQIFQTLEFYNYFCKKICELINGINIATNEFARLKKQTKKLSQITLSLVRNSKSLNDKSFDRSQQQQTGHNSQIQILLQKMSYDFPINFLHRIYKHFQQTLSYLKNHASSKLNRKKKLVQDSMEISYIDQTVLKPQKRPCKKEMWMWEKWQNHKEFEVDTLKVSKLGEIKQFANSLIGEISQSKEIERFSCSLETKSQPNGFLIITQKQIKFQTSQGNCILHVQYSMLQDLKIVVRMFGKVISLETSHGNIYFKGFRDIQEALQTIQQARNSSGAPVSKSNRAVVELTPQQLTAIQQRKTKIKPQLPKLQQFQFVHQINLENITIDHVYQLIYSDKQISIKGKIQPSFLSYTMKKSGASNYQTTKYDSLGPKFYTHEEGVNFINSPLYSIRIMNYDVKLPPVPFMPKYAQSREQCKIFWISNQEFQYFMHINTSGAPKSDTFFVQILHKIQQQDKNVKINFYRRIFFTQDSYLKNTIKSNATQQTTKQLKATAAQIKKFCSQSCSNLQGGKKGSDQALLQNQQETKEEQEKGSNIFVKLLQKIKTLLGQGNTDNTNKGSQSNKSLAVVIVLIIVLLINVILMVV